MTRPAVLFPLFASLTSLPGLGPKSAEALASIHIEKPRDLIFHLPFNGIDRTLQNTVEDSVFPKVCTVEVTVLSHIPAQRKGGPYRVLVADQMVEFEITFFHAREDYVRKILPEGARRIVSGKVEMFDGRIQMVHPDHAVAVEAAHTLPSFEPVWPLVAGVTGKALGKAIAAAMTRVPDLDEWIDPALRQREKWPSFQSAISAAQAPTNLADLDWASVNRRRLAYDEVFAHQLSLALARAAARRTPGRSTKGTGQLVQQFLASLPYAPTGAQRRAVKEIEADLVSSHRMNRLLQGDVGAGKTLVAFMALLAVVEAKGQGVLMAPTEILARQHLESLLPLAAALDVRIDVLTGRDAGVARASKLAKLANGGIDILIGTHAVFQKGVEFTDLRLAVIDEQHRFGVRQRFELGAKGQAVDVLVMTATPIPRSLALAQYGDMDVSILDEKPPGRKPIQTVAIPLDRMEQVVKRLEATNAQAYWVCPLVAPSETSTLTAAETRYQTLRAALGQDSVGLVHGQMPPAEKDAAMARFVSGETRVLVATTVIEVGVNVPNATIMVIENAENFGLAQLHQLRGRVGRGQAASSCILLYAPPLGESAEKRLSILRETEDGFRIADTDLQMRGAGDMIGTAQSGLPRFRVADLEHHAGLLKLAQSDARKLLSDDPNLSTDRGKAAQTLLWLMEQEKAVQLLQVG